MPQAARTPQPQSDTAAQPSREELVNAVLDDYERRLGGPQDIVIFGDGSPFTFAFDLAGCLGGPPRAHVPRVIAGWGLTGDPCPEDLEQLVFHPRSRRRGDQRSHLLGRALGGRYGQNLVDSWAGLNQASTPLGRRWRRLESAAAAAPGTWVLRSTTYGDPTARPAALVAVNDRNGQRVSETFENPEWRLPERSRAREAVPFPVEDAIERCLPQEHPARALLERVWRTPPDRLTGSERRTVSAAAGALARPITKVLLERHGWTVLWQRTGGEQADVDLTLLAPDGTPVVVKVFGKAVSRDDVPRVSDDQLAAMSRDGVRPTTAGARIDGTDVHGAVVAVNLAARTWRMAVTNDFGRLHPVTHLDQLSGLGWTREPRTRRRRRGGRGRGAGDAAAGPVPASGHSGRDEGR